MEELKPLPPHLYYEVKVEPAVLAPEVQAVPTPQDNRNIIEEQAKQLAQAQKDLEDYKALTEERFNKLVALIQKK